MLSLVVPEQERGEYYGLIELYFIVHSLQSFASEKRMWPRTFTREAKHMAQVFIRGVLEKLPVSSTEEFNNAVQHLLAELNVKYLHMLYLSRFNVLPKPSLVVFMVFPPQVTWRERYQDYITPDAYIRVTFFTCPVKRKTNREKKGAYNEALVAKYFMEHLHVTAEPPHMETEDKIRRYRQKLPQPLRKIFDQLLEKELEKRKDLLHAFRIVRREITKLIIASMWLLTTYLALKSGIVKVVDLPVRNLRIWERRGHPLPEPRNMLSEDDLKILDSVLNKYFDTSLRDITWLSLIELTAERVGKPLKLMLRELGLSSVG